MGVNKRKARAVYSPDISINLEREEKNKKERKKMVFFVLFILVLVMVMHAEMNVNGAPVEAEVKQFPGFHGHLLSKHYAG